ncbi:MAG: hypothetical protein HOQ28_07970 [Thermoleophilia bacterium]|nr:hypothetical protein [Thermoleophilia bacterium]
MLTGDGSLDERRVRAAGNQSVFREVNERIVEISERWSAPPQFVCECESAQCAQTIMLTRTEYETVRGDPGCFLVAHGHDIPEVEEIVSSTERFVVVRKLGAGRDVAVRFDPRRKRGVEPVL